MAFLSVAFPVIVSTYRYYQGVLNNRIHYVFLLFEYICNLKASIFNGDLGYSYYL